MNFNYFYLARRNPSIKEEDWVSTWRSHLKFAQQFPDLWPVFKSLQYCARIRAPKINGATINPPGLSTEYDGAARIAGRSAEVRPKMTPEIRAAIDTDELRVFSTHVKHFSFRCRETLAWGGAGPYAAVIFRFLARKPGTSRDDFLARWNGPHGEIATKAVEAAGSVKRYMQNGLIEEPPPGYPFDGVSEMWFDSTEEATQSLLDAKISPVAGDLPSFCDMDRSVTLLTEMIQHWEYPE